MEMGEYSIVGLRRKWGLRLEEVKRDIGRIVRETKLGLNIRHML